MTILDLKKEYTTLLNKVEQIIIIWNKGHGTPTGRSDYYTIIALDKNNKEISYDLTYGFSIMFNYRLSKDNQIIITGYGFSKTDHIKEHLKELKTELNFIVV